VDSEDTENGRAQLSAIIENIELAARENKPICQDTGTQTFFVTVGTGFPYADMVEAAIIEGVRKATEIVPLRANAVDLLTGRNSGNVTAFPKGGGSENMSALRMLKPSEGMEGVKKFVLEHMVRAGGNPCPPTVVGVGIGGGADIAMELAKRSLLRPVGDRSRIDEIAGMEG